MNVLRGIHLAANTTWGVFEVSPIDYPDRDVLSFRDFMNELPHLTEQDGIIYTYVLENTPEYYELLENYTVEFFTFED